MDPKQVALQNKAELESKGYVVDAQGNVTYPPNGGGFFPPWVWSQSLSNAPTSWKIPGSDPSSAWASMYQGSGPFTNHSKWDSNNATYDGSIDWGTLLGTVAAGSLIGAGAGAAFSGSGSGATAAAPSAGMTSASVAGDGLLPATQYAGYSALPSAASANVAGAASAGAGVPFTTSGVGTVGGNALTSATAGASASAPWIKALAGLASVLGGHAIGSAAQSGAVPPQLNDLLNMSVQRQQQQQPLTQAVDQGIYQMLPNFARTGTSMPNVPTNAAGGLTALLGGK